MIVCQKCNTLSKPGEKTHLVVAEKRTKTYENEQRVVSQGWEIAKEIRICDPCELLSRLG